MLHPVLLRASVKAQLIRQKDTTHTHNATFDWFAEKSKMLRKNRLLYQYMDSNIQNAVSKR